MKRPWFLLLALLASCALLVPAVQAQNTNPFSQAFSLTAAGQRLPTIVFVGQMQSCSIVVYNSGGGFTIIPQVASDNAGGSNPTPSWVTASTVNSGSISATGTFTGNVSQQGLTSFGGVLSALTSGTITGVETCSTASGAQPVTLASLPPPVQPSPLYTMPVHDAAPVQPSPLYTSAVHDAAPVQPSPLYTTPVSCATPSCNVAVKSGPYATASPSTLVAGATTGNESILTSSSATACTSIAVGPFPTLVLVNSGPAMTVFPQFYDEAGSPTCAAADLILGDGTSVVLGPAQVITLFGGVKNGLAYKLSGSLTSNFAVYW